MDTVNALAVIVPFLAGFAIGWELYRAYHRYEVPKFRVDKV
jgi:hypothetical protein